MITIPFFCFILLSLGVACVLEAKIEMAFSLSSMYIILVLFAGALIDNLKMGIYGILVSIVIIYIYIYI